MYIREQHNSILNTSTKLYWITFLKTQKDIIQFFMTLV